MNLWGKEIIGPWGSNIWLPDKNTFSPNNWPHVTLPLSQSMVIKLRAYCTFITDLKLGTVRHSLISYNAFLHQILTFYWPFGNIWPSCFINKSNFSKKLVKLWEKEIIGPWGTNIWLPEMMGLLTQIWHHRKS